MYIYIFILMVIFILIFIFQISMLHDLNATLVIAVIIVPTWLFHGSSWCFTSLRFKDPGSDTTCSDAEGQDSKT